MGAIAVKLLTDTEHAPRVERSLLGMAGRRVYRVYTADPGEAVALVPQPGTPWSASLPTLRVQGVSAQMESAASTVGDAVPGSTLAEVLYATPSAPSGGEIPPEGRLPGAAYTSWVDGETTVSVRTDLAGKLIANGQGAPVPVSTLRAEVTVFSVAPPNISQLVALRRALNANPITFPAMYGSSQTYSVAAGQARFAGWRVASVDPETGVFETVYAFEVAEDFLFRWSVVDENGDVTQDVASPVIESVAIPALWTL